MTCSPQFVSGIDFECIMSILTDVRTGKPTQATLKNLLWVGGCAVSTIGPLKPTDPNTIHVFGASGGIEDKPTTVDACCDRIESFCAQAKVARGTDQAGWKPDPENLKALFAWLMQLAQMILPLIIHA